MEENYQQINLVTDRLFTVGKDNIAKVNLVPLGQKNFPWNQYIIHKPDK